MKEHETYYLALSEEIQKALDDAGNKKQGEANSMPDREVMIQCTKALCYELVALRAELILHRKYITRQI